MICGLREEGGLVGVFAVLVVCRGNQCRSPAAEHVLRQALTEVSAPVHGRRSKRPAQVRQHFELLSAGTQAAAGMPIHPLTADAMRAAGFSVPSHSSSRISQAAVRAADLILTADRDQRAVAASLVTGAASRTFTLLEFAALAETVDGRGVRTPAELVGATAAARTTTWNDPGWDLPDPIHGGAAFHAQMVGHVVEASLAITTLFSSMTTSTEDELVLPAADGAGQHRGNHRG